MSDNEHKTFNYIQILDCKQNKTFLLFQVHRKNKKLYKSLPKIQSVN